MAPKNKARTQLRGSGQGNGGSRPRGGGGVIPCPTAIESQAASVLAMRDRICGLSVSVSRGRKYVGDSRDALEGGEPPLPHPGRPAYAQPLSP